MKEKGHLIKAVDAGSIAEQLEIESGDRLLRINGNEIEDIFDYQYYLNSESILMLLEKADGELWELEIEHNYEDLGITFENSLMSDYKSCSNKCAFCFIDQMPPGMRETLYFKDDDSRLSFLQGNYVTLTNMKEHDIQRIIRFHLAPINISVHTTNPELRCKMLHNRFAGESLKHMDTLFEAEVPMNGQIVLCKGLNDGEELDRTISDLSAYLPYMESVSVVPVGLTRFRDGLYPLEPIEKEDAEAVLEIVERWQQKLYAEHGTHFIHASDEFYLKAERPMPEEARYDGFPQLENGVGMLRLLELETEEALKETEWGEIPEEEISIATGRLAYPAICELAEKIMDRFPQKKIRVYEIRNDYFGEMITVAGLITGQDLKNQLTGQNLGSRLLLPCCMFRSGEEVFLDDMTRDELQNALQVSINIVKSSGQDLVSAILYTDAGDELPEYEPYELKEI